MGMGSYQYTTVRKFKINWTTFLKNCSDIVRSKKMLIWENLKNGSVGNK